MKELVVPSCFCFCCFVVVKQLPFRAIMILFFRCLVNEWTVRAIMTFVFVLSKNERFVVSWLFCCQRMNFSCNHDFVLFLFWSMNEHFVQYWFCFCQGMNLSCNHDFCFWSIMTFRAIMTFVFVKEWTVRAIRTLFVCWSMNELFVQSWFAFFCFWSMNELVVQSWPLCFFCKWMDFSCSHDLFCLCQWKNFSCNQYYYVLFCQIMNFWYNHVTLVLSKNDMFVQSSFFVVFVSCLGGLRPRGPKAWGA